MYMFSHVRSVCGVAYSYIVRHIRLTAQRLESTWLMIVCCVLWRSNSIIIFGSAIFNFSLKSFTFAFDIRLILSAICRIISSDNKS